MSINVELLAFVLEKIEYRYKGDNLMGGVEDDVLTKTSFREFSYQNDDDKILLKCDAEILIDSSNFILELKAMGVGSSALIDSIDVDNLDDEQAGRFFSSLTGLMLVEANKRVNEFLEHTFTSPSGFVNFFNKTQQE